MLNVCSSEPNVCLGPVRTNLNVEVNIEVKLPSEVGVGLAVAEDAEVENLLAAAEEPIPILATVGAQVPDTEVA